MSLNNPLANVLSFIQNYDKLGRKELITKNNSKIIREVLKIMQENGYIGGFEEMPESFGKSLKIHLIGSVNASNVIRPQYQIKLENYESFEKRYLPAKEFGIIIISTDQGIMIHREAKEKRLGGKLLAFCY